jgi:ankyrin repeat protein
MNNKRLILLTVYCFFAVVLALPVQSFANNESGTSTEAEQHFEKANELRKAADYDAAITEYEKVIGLSPKSKIAQNAQYWIGQSYFGAGQFDAALAAFQKLLDEYPTSTVDPSIKQMMERVQQAKKNKSLFEAVTKGDIEQVKKLIAQGADVNVAEGENAWTPLLAAAKGAHSEVVKVLLANGANVNLAETYGYTALYYAIWNDDEEIVKALISGGADVNKGPADGEGDYSPLCYAIWRGHASIVKDVLDAGADLNVKDESGYTPFYWAAFTSKKEVFDLILSRGDWPDTIYLAASRGDMDRVTTLIEGGTNVTAKDEFGCTTLHWAGLADKASGRLPMLELLISKGVDMNVKAGRGGRTILHMMCVDGDKEATELLICKGADISVRARSGSTALFYAAINGYANIVELLIEKGADVNTPVGRGQTALAIANQRGHDEVVSILRQHGATETLHGAVTSGNLDEVKRLISEGQDVNSRDSEGRTPLHLAATWGTTDMVQLLLTRKAYVDAQDNEAYTPLGRAARRQRKGKEFVEILLAGGANIQNLGTALHSLAWNGQIEMLDFMISRGANIEAKSIYQTTPLREAVYNKQYKTVEFLISKGADVHASSRYSGGPIFTAVERNDKEMIELLIANGAEIKAVLSGETALHWAMARNLPEMTRFLVTKGCETSPVNLAAFYGELDRVKKLVAEGADVNAKDNGSYSPLHCAVCGEHKDMVEFLISHGAHVNAKTSRGWTPLMGAQSTDIVRLLLVNDAPVNMNTETGVTALHVAVNRGNTEAVKLLLDYRANVNAKCPSTHGGWEGWTPFHVACRKGNLDIVGLLLAHVADVNAKSDKGDTPLSLARKNQHAEVVELLLKHGAKE